MSKLENIPLGPFASRIARLREPQLEFYANSLDSTQIVDREGEFGIGEINKRRVLVKHGQRYVGKNVVVSFGNEVDQNEPKAYLLNTDVAKDFQPLPREGYVLTCTWENGMDKKDIAPTFHEFRQYFDFGPFSEFYFLKGESRREEGHYRVHLKSKEKRNMTVGQILNKDFNNDRVGPLVIVSDGREKINTAKMAINSRDLKRVRVMPFRRPWLKR